MEIIAKKFTAENLPVEKLAHLRFTIEGIENANILVALLNQRKSLMESDKAIMSEYELNERAILLHKTNNELATLHTNIIKKKMYRDDLVRGLVDMLNEMEERWDEIMLKARKRQEQNSDLKEQLAKENLDEFEENWDTKINHYILVKNLVYPKSDNSNTLKKA